MKFSLSALFRGAAALWRHASDLWLRIGLVFFFLPVFAMRLFVPFAPPPATATADQRTEAMFAFFQANGHWLGLQMLLQLFGASVILVLLLDPGKLRVGDAMLRTLALMPRLVLAWGVAFALIFVGTLAFFLPGLYAAGRTLLTGARVIAHPEENPLRAFADGIATTRGQGWNLTIALMTTIGAAYVALSVLAVPEALAGDAAASSIGTLVFAALEAGIAMASGIAAALIQVAAYRLLGSAKRGT